MFSLYGFTLGIAIIISWNYFTRTTTLPKKLQDKLFLGLAISGIVGARLYHVLDQWSYYSHHFPQIFNLRLGGLGIYGAVGLGLLYLVIFCKHYSKNLFRLASELTPSLVLAQAIGRWGNYFNTEVFGTPTYSFWGQYIPYYLRPENYRSYTLFHPVWLYESLASLLLFTLLHKTKSKLALYLLGYGTIRFLLEFLRFDTWQTGGIKVAQIISIFLIISGIFILFLPILRQKNKKY